MKDEDFFIKERICIVGLGLMGGSLALALRGYCSRIIGVDPDPGTLALAREKQVVDFATEDLTEALVQADLVVLGAPVRTNLALLEQIPALHPEPLAILDLSSTKSAIVAAMEGLPDGYSALGGHPMCGKEFSGLAYADAKLFWDATFALTETTRTTPALKHLVARMLEIISARPLWIDADTHDRWTAATSHLPYLIAAALAGSTPQEVSPLVGPGFLSTSRLAASEITMMLDILTTNRVQVLTALAHYKEALGDLEASLQNCPERLRPQLESAQNHRDALVQDNKVVKLAGT